MRGRRCKRGHAIANGVYVASPNRVGLEKIPGTPGGDDGIEFFGSSFIADPFGRILQKGSREKEEILIATVDPKVQEETRRHWPFCGIGGSTPTAGLRSDSSAELQRAITTAICQTSTRQAVRNRPAIRNQWPIDRLGKDFASLSIRGFGEIGF